LPAERKAEILILKIETMILIGGYNDAMDLAELAYQQVK
jgi:hypothetical protein